MAPPGTPATSCRCLRLTNVAARHPAEPGRRVGGRPCQQPARSRVALPFDTGDGGQRTAWQIRIGDDPDRAAAYPVLADADWLLVEAVERVWLGVTEIEVIPDRLATPSSLRPHR
jgi:hypothetical protein